jgi:hypothetical protein
MNLATKESVSVRLDRLERENAVLKGLAVLLLLGFGAVLFKCTSLVRPPKQLAAEQFVVKDKEGRVRASLALRAGDSPHLTMYDRRGREQVSLRSLPDDSTSLDFSARGESLLSLRATSNGSAVVNMFDSRHGSSSGLYMMSDGTQGIGFREGQRGVAMTLRPRGPAEVSFSDEDGREIGSVCASPGGVPQLLVKDALSARDPLPASSFTAPFAPTPTLDCRPGLFPTEDRIGRTSCLLPQRRPSTGSSHQVPPWRECRTCYF